MPESALIGVWVPPRMFCTSIMWIQITSLEIGYAMRVKKPDDYPAVLIVALLRGGRQSQHLHDS